MLSLFDVDNDKKLQKIFANVKSKSYILSCYDIISNYDNKNSKNPKDMKFIEDNPCIFSCQVELLELADYNPNQIKLDCKVITLYEGFFGCKELFEGNKLSLIVNKNKLQDKDNFIFDKLIFDKVFSFYADNELNYENNCDNIYQIQKTWKEVKNMNKNNCYIQLYSLENTNLDCDLDDLVLF